ncbi:hypothetical protein F5884DRAFT_820688 [Xylogone sp. PMI_703]|nr:hypothetical protein F5884DRAFT_820688 [Xylogone sp. PMI_703]
MENKKLDVAIVGGSLSGLMHGIVLKRLGHDVHIFEQVTEETRQNEAAGMRAGPHTIEFLEKYDLTREPWAITYSGGKFIRKDSSTLFSLNTVTTLTSWTTLHYRLRANFDKFKSEYCLNPPAALDSDGDAIYSPGKRVVAADYRDGRVALQVENVVDGTKRTFTPDLVIVAEGSRSVLREAICNIKRPYLGYVSWRGCVPENEVSDETKELFGERVTFFKMKNSYILVYIIPGKGGSLEKGERLYNYVWYVNVDGDSPEYAEMMTDKFGHRHRFTLPPGYMDPAVWEKQKVHARKVLAPPFLELVEKAPQPFVSGVAESQMPRGRFYDNKMIFVGDALSQFRPHVAFSSDQAALDALLLEKVMLGEISWTSWEKGALKYSNKMRSLSKVIGTFFQFGGIRFGVAVCQFLGTLVKNFVSSFF